MKQPTIRDVAAHAGVSPASVSRYLNNKSPLPADMGVMIERAIQALGYRPNVLARRLSLGTTETIGFVTADIAAPFFASVASAAEEEAERHGYSLMICNTRNQVSRELEFLRRQREGHFDGLIFMTNHVDDGQLRNALAQTPNVVLIDEDVPDANCHKFFIDNHRGGYLATRHLIEAGHRRIGHVTGPLGMLSVDERLAGYRQGLRDAGIAFDDELICSGSYEFEAGVTGFDRLWSLDKKPTAIFATSDLLALGIYSGAQRSAVVIPSDLSVVGFDDLPHLEFMNPPLTSIRQPARELGQRGILALLGKLEARSERLPITLIERGSVSFPRKE